jgi:hypothetical protein
LLMRFYKPGQSQNLLNALKLKSSTWNGYVSKFDGQLEKTSCLIRQSRRISNMTSLEPRWKLSLPRRSEKEFNRCCYCLPRREFLAIPSMITRLRKRGSIMAVWVFTVIEPDSRGES